MQLYCQASTWHFSQHHWPAEALRAAACADVGGAEQQGSVWGILASRWNGSRIFPIWTRARQLRGRRCNYRYGQGPRTPGHRDDLSCAMTLPFPHLFQGRTEERERDRHANRWVWWQERRDGVGHKWYASTPLRFQHNWAYRGMAHTHKRKRTGILTGKRKSSEQRSREGKHGSKWAIRVGRSVVKPVFWIALPFGLGVGANTVIRQLWCRRRTSTWLQPRCDLSTFAFQQSFKNSDFGEEFVMGSQNFLLLNKRGALLKLQLNTEGNCGRLRNQLVQYWYLPNTAHAKKEEPASQYVSIELWEKVCLFSPISKRTNLSGLVMDCSIICGCCLNLAMSALNGRVFGSRLAP